MLKVCTIIAILITTLNCFRIMDDSVKSHAFIDKYCAKIGDCEEGSHVMCTYYDPQRLFGPLCSGTRNITMIQEYAEKILDIVNGIRSQTSRGLLKAKNGEPLPRGYGIYKLVWDNELATYAQLWANQCTLLRDRCRATSKFPDPGQVGGVNRFTFDDSWTPAFRQVTFEKPGFTHGKVLYALTHILKSLFMSTYGVMTPELINNITDAALIENYPAVQLFFGSVTHVGCGISAFKEYAYYDDGKRILYNTIFLVCNYSARLRLNTPIYTTQKPTEPGFTQECGCPPKYDGDNNCLCYRNSCDKGACKTRADLILLPIFTVEHVTLPTLQEETTKHDITAPPREKVPKSHFCYNPHSGCFSRLNPEVIHEDTAVKTVSEPKIQAAPGTKYRRRFDRNRDETGKLSEEVNDVQSDYIGDARNSRVHNERILDSKIKSESRTNIAIRESTEIDPRKYNDYSDADINQHVLYKKYSQLIDPEVLMLLIKLEREIDNIELGDREREIIHEKIASIYRTLLESANTIEKRYLFENEIHNHENQIKMYQKAIDDNSRRYTRRNLMRNNDKFIERYTNEGIHSNHGIDNLNAEANRIRDTYDIRYDSKEENHENNYKVVNDVDNLLKYDNRDSFLKYVDRYRKK